MNFNEFIKQHTDANSKGGKVKVKAAIRERWQKRVVNQELDKQGAAGADAYLQRYGKSIAAPKVIDLALCAIIHGCDDMALVFWRTAYSLTFGKWPDRKDNADLVRVEEEICSINETPVEPVPGLPDQLQPGTIVPMQPSDTKLNREVYIKDDNYLGQPKRNGEKRIITKAGNKVFFQTRSMRLVPAPNKHFQESLLRVPETFVLEGEIWWCDCRGGEHIGPAWAAAANEEYGQPQAHTSPMYSIFKALYSGGKNLLKATEEERVLEGARLAGILFVIRPGLYEPCPTAWTEAEKRDLVNRQELEGREGEVWTLGLTPYLPGKENTGACIRTKYTQEMVLWVQELTPTTADDRPYGALVVSRDQAGKKMIGKVGTGGDRSSQREIVDLFKNGPFKIRVETRGLTPRGKLWHPAFLEIVQ